MEEKLDLSIVLPCKDEAPGIGSCIAEIRGFLETSGLRGEIVVVDNGSTDGSGDIARELGVRVICEAVPGYGSALRAGIAAAKAPVIIMGDCDTTYDFTQIGLLYCPMAEGRFDMVIGDRFKGGIEKGAMPLSHVIGVKALSALGRMSFKTDVYDFHCGLRGLTRDAAEKLEFECDGMEFATEFIGKAAQKGLRIGQVPVRLRRCDAQRSSKLRTIPDGFRHLFYIIRKR